MKKTLLSTAVVAAMFAPFGAFADDVDSVTGDTNITTTQTDMLLVGDTGSIGVEQKDSNNFKANGSFLTGATNGYNDVNSHNIVDIGEDGIVASANDLSQAVVSSDLNDSISANQIAQDGTLVVGAVGQSALIAGAGQDRSQANAMTGSFTHYSGIASAQQNIGSVSAVSQSAVVQSNGSI